MHHCLKGQLQGLKEKVHIRLLKANFNSRKKLRVARKKTALLNAGKIDFSKHENEFKGIVKNTIV